MVARGGVVLMAITPGDRFATEEGEAEIEYRVKAVCAKKLTPS